MPRNNGVKVINFFSGFEQNNPLHGLVYGNSVYQDGMGTGMGVGDLLQ